MLIDVDVTIKFGAFLKTPLKQIPAFFLLDVEKHCESESQLDSTLVSTSFQETKKKDPEV